MTDSEYYPATEVFVEESLERWSEFTLSDGTVLCAKVQIFQIYRVQDQVDSVGKPMYKITSGPFVVVKSFPEELGAAKN